MMKNAAVIVSIAALPIALAAPLRAEVVGSESAPPAAVAESAPAPHPIITRVAALIDTLGAHGIAVDSEADAAALVECVARQADPFARVFDADAFAHVREKQAGWDYHTGYRFTVKNGVPFIAGLPGAGVPALRIGDEVTHIDREPAANLTIGDVLARIRGHSATTIALTIRRDGASFTAEVARVREPLPSIETAEVWPREIGYARINGLYRSETGVVLALLNEWNAGSLAGGILDLRGAGGDDIAGAAALAEPFASPGSLLFSVRDRDDNDLNSFRASGDTRAIGLPLMVLTDETTTGAAELFAAVASDSLRGVLTIGRPTAGDPGIRDGIELPGDGTLYIAVRRIVTGNGAILDGRSGSAPNLRVDSRSARIDYEPADQPDRRERLAVEALDRELRDRVRGDAVLQRALDVVLGLKALNIRAGGAH